MYNWDEIARENDIFVPGNCKSNGHNISIIVQELNWCCGKVAYEGSDQKLYEMAGFVGCVSRGFRLKHIFGLP